MNFLRRLFGGGGAAPRGDQRYYPVYVRPKACREVVRVSVDLMNDLSLTDEEDGYIVRKVARGSRCPFPVEIMLRFNRQRTLINQEISQGEWATESDYQAFIGEYNSKP